MAAAAAKGGLKCLEVCGYCCQVIACGVETLKSIWNALTKICTCGQGWKGMLINSLTVVASEEDPDYKDFELPVVASRRFTDFPAILLFLATAGGMCYVMNQALMFGRPEVYTNGVDSWTNVCGASSNKKFAGVPNSGVNMSAYSKLFILDFLTNPDGITAESATEDYLQICVTECPTGTISFRCKDYLDKVSGYESGFQTKLCTGSSSGEIPVFAEKNNRCVPTELFEDVSIQRQNSLLNLYSNNWLHNLIHDCGICAAELTWLILIALAFTLIFTIIVHAAANALCWYSFATFFIVGSAATGYMWYLYSVINNADTGISIYSARSRYSDPKTFAEGVLKMAFRFFPIGRNASVPQAGYSIVFRDAAIYSTATVVAGCIVCILVGRRNMDACAVVFEEGTKCTMSVKWLYILPITSTLSLCFAFAMWMYTLTFVTAIFLEDPRTVDSSNPSGSIVKGYYVPNLVYTNWILLFEFLGMIWVFNFILSCQHMIICMVVGTWYFTVNKDEMYRPVRVAISRLIRKHIGSAMAGAFMVGYFGILRAPLSFMQSRIVTATERAKRLQKIQLADGEPEYAIPPSTGPKKPASQGAGKSSQPKKKSRKKKNVEEFDGDNAEKAKAVRKAHVAVETWKGVNKACSPCFCLLNHVLIYISDLNYSMVALKSLWFLQSGREIRNRLNEVEKIKGIPAISSFALFLGKLTITIAVLPVGFLLLKDKEGVFMYGYPLAVSALLSFLVSHVAFSLFEASTGAIFLCYVEDVSLNKGSKSKPYFGRKEFFKKFHDALEERSPEEAAKHRYTKVHWDENSMADRQQKMMEEEDLSDSFDEDSEDDNQPSPPPEKPTVKTVDETKKKKKKGKDLEETDPSSLFLLMPKKDKSKKKDKYEPVYDEPFEENEYDDPYEKENLYDEIPDEMDDKKKKEKQKTKKEKKKMKKDEEKAAKKKDQKKKGEKRQGKDQEKDQSKPPSQKEKQVKEKTEQKRKRQKSRKKKLKQLNEAGEGKKEDKPKKREKDSQGDEEEDEYDRGDMSENVREGLKTKKQKDTTSEKPKRSRPPKAKQNKPEKPKRPPPPKTKNENSEKPKRPPPPKTKRKESSKPKKPTPTNPKSHEKAPTPTNKDSEKPEKSPTPKNKSKVSEKPQRPPPPKTKPKSKEKPERPPPPKQKAQDSEKPQRPPPPKVKPKSKEKPERPPPPKQKAQDSEKPKRPPPPKSKPNTSEKPQHPEAPKTNVAKKPKKPPPPKPKTNVTEKPKRPPPPKTKTKVEEKPKRPPLPKSKPNATNKPKRPPPPKKSKNSNLKNK